MSSEHVRWHGDGKSCTLDLGKLHPALVQIHLERRWRDWLAQVKVGETTYVSTGDNRLEALANLLNYDDLLEALKGGGMAQVP